MNKPVDGHQVGEGEGGSNIKSGLNMRCVFRTRTLLDFEQIRSEYQNSIFYKFRNVQ